MNFREFVKSCLLKGTTLRASIIPEDNNSLQKKQFYIMNVARTDRHQTVIDALCRARPHLDAFRQQQT
ncbi:hypothetical protein PFISCL1PPCAC_17003 [Pristionchus fissidentatus]|uniref:Uncharacterized protein n=1 Tax=Pristionchus fissidentatus TaxID=1538716 RepID=A0AAV5W1L1_9BILA|nr:hypothetical protein PFISCL1PPCAC_17003 [Pristionchus fissidentatus]